MKSNFKMAAAISTFKPSMQKAGSFSHSLHPRKHKNNSQAMAASPASRPYNTTTANRCVCCAPIAAESNTTAIYQSAGVPSLPEPAPHTSESSASFLGFQWRESGALIRTTKN